MISNSKKIITCLATILIFFTAMNEVYGGSNSRNMSINVRVLPKFEYNILKDLPGFEITESDLENGYKDIMKGTIISVSTNNRNGYLLSICKQNTSYSNSITVSTDNDSLELSSYGCMEIYKSPNGSSGETKNINYRVHFNPQTKTGFYPSPVAVSAYPL